MLTFVIAYLRVSDMSPLSHTLQATCSALSLSLPLSRFLYLSLLVSQLDVGPPPERAIQNGGMWRDTIDLRHLCF